jgi:3-methyl-2-oxobutanoate hydroxymethyltransferase
MKMDTEYPDRAHPKRKVHYFRKLKEEGKRIAVITAYDYPTAYAADSAGVDAILVGDSLGPVALGYQNTLPVTMEMMLHHTAAVRRAVKSAFLIADMPFLSYQISPEEAVRNAGRFVQEAGAEAVKIEGAHDVLPAIERILGAGIPVLGHIGLLPQSIHRRGGYRVRGKDAEDAERLLAEAQLLESVGVFAIVLEAVIPSVAAKITAELKIPTIGIGAGPNCDGQVLVFSDVVGLTIGPVPKFAKQYGNVFQIMKDCVEKYVEEVRSASFPDEKHQY